YHAGRAEFITRNTIHTRVRYPAAINTVHHPAIAAPRTRRSKTSFIAVSFRLPSQREAPRSHVTMGSTPSCSSTRSVILASSSRSALGDRGTPPGCTCPTPACLLIAFRIRGRVVLLL